MEISLIKLSLERLLNKVEGLEKQNRKLKKRIRKLETEKYAQVSEKKPQTEDTLIDTKEVLQILGISYNTLQAIIKKNLVVPIRINQRRIRYSKNSILCYIQSKGG